MALGTEGDREDQLSLAFSSLTLNLSKHFKASKEPASGRVALLTTAITKDGATRRPPFLCLVFRNRPGWMWMIWNTRLLTLFGSWFIPAPNILMLGWCFRDCRNSITVIKVCVTAVTGCDKSPQRWTFLSSALSCVVDVWKWFFPLLRLSRHGWCLALGSPHTFAEAHAAHRWFVHQVHVEHWPWAVSSDTWGNRTQGLYPHGACILAELADS